MQYSNINHTDILVFIIKNNSDKFNDYFNYLVLFIRSIGIFYELINIKKQEYSTI